MRCLKLNNFEIRPYIERALFEDIPIEDISTNAIYREKKRAIVSLIVKEDAVISGLDVFELTFRIVDNNILIKRYVNDGDFVKKGDIIVEVEADIRTLLSCERVALNFLQRMSGIATYTNDCVKTLGDKNIKILDTRKTTPNMRIFEKYSVKVGGGENHRYNLSDGIMLKDNHIAAAGSIINAVNLAREYSPFVKKIEVEVETLGQVKEAVEASADIIMLDNMNIDQIKEASKIINKKAIIEVSGNITKDNLIHYRNLEIDYISSGAITYMAKPIDMSMKNLRYD